MDGVAVRVVIVDDEEDLVWTLTRQVQRARPELSVKGFTDPAEALEQIRREPPDVLVTDVRMPKLSGIELVLAARQVSPSIAVVVITAFATVHVRKEVMAQGSVTFLEKPFELSALLEAIDRAPAARTGFEGAISLPMLPDLVQMYALARVDGALEISGHGSTGVIWFRAGEIVHARCGERSGPTAFFDLLLWQGGRFRLEPGASPPERTIDASWQSLLIEGARRVDEGTLVPEPEAPARHAARPLEEIRGHVVGSLPGAWAVDGAPGPKLGIAPVARPDTHLKENSRTLVGRIDGVEEARAQSLANIDCGRVLALDGIRFEFGERVPGSDLGG